MAVRFDTSNSFLNDRAAKLLTYLQEPTLRLISGGIFLQRIILSIVEPPFFWDAFVQGFQSGALNPNAIRSFAWLIFELISLPKAQGVKYCNFVKKSALDVQLLNSADYDVRQLGQKIKHNLSIHEAGTTGLEENGPGGRHDNDFQNIREISIMPTPDEVLATERPFIRLSQAIEAATGAQRVEMFIDNQFRLLREDMLGDIREEWQNITGTKKAAYHKGITIENLEFASIECPDPKSRQPWTMHFRCTAPLGPLAKLSSEKRQKYLKDNKNFLRHQSLACLIMDGTLIGFPAFRRDENLLSEKLPTIVLQIIEDSTFSRLLSKLKSAASIKLVQLDTAVFAYEPILHRLQEIKDLSLSEELICWDKNSQLNRPPCFLEEVISGIKRLSGRDIRQFLNISKSGAIVLDSSQADSLISALSMRLSLIQGPPGK